MNIAPILARQHLSKFKLQAIQISNLPNERRKKHNEEVFGWILHFRVGKCTAGHFDEIV